MAQVESRRPPSPASPAALVAPSDRSRWLWCALAGTMLIGSGVVRSVQADRYDRAQLVEIRAPFPLKDIPRTIGEWQVVDGSDTALDATTTRITGSTDHIIRTYSDRLTGVALSVLILFGPAEPVLPHTPQVCYPASGFQGVGATIDHEIALGSARGAAYRSSVFSKSGGRSVIQQVVYHSYRYDGTWSPTISEQKIPRQKSGIFKVQIQRRVLEGERRGQDEPIESFVAALTPVLEAMIRDAAAAAAPSTADPAPAPTAPAPPRPA